MVSTIVALVMPWYSIGKNRAVVTSILFKSLGDAECMASLMPLQLQLPEHLLHSLHISSSGLCLCDAKSRDTVLRECKHRLVRLFVAWVGIYKGECRSSLLSLSDLCLMNQQGT